MHKIPLTGKISIYTFCPIHVTRLNFFPNMIWGSMLLSASRNLTNNIPGWTNMLLTSPLIHVVYKDDEGKWHFSLQNSQPTSQNTTYTTMNNDMWHQARRLSLCSGRVRLHTLWWIWTQPGFLSDTTPNWIIALLQQSPPPHLLSLVLTRNISLRLREPWDGQKWPRGGISATCNPFLMHMHLRVLII